LGERGLEIRGQNIHSKKPATIVVIIKAFFTSGNSLDPEILRSVYAKQPMEQDLNHNIERIYQPSSATRDFL